MQADPTERRTEPWPWILASMLALMMLVSIGFAVVAYRTPDPVIVDEAFEADGGRSGFHPREVEAQG